MADNTNIEMVALSDIRDLDWPTDGDLVRSFRKTLQSGGQIPLLLVNRVWHDDATWHYEIIDGFHRYEAAKAEGNATMQCQVVEYAIETARYNRALACLGKPAEITRDRAILALKEAFISEIVARLGDDVTIYEPVLDEQGQITKRRRKDPLPSEPMDVLQVFTDHLMVREETTPLVQVKKHSEYYGKTWQNVRTVHWKGWEKPVVAWLDRMTDAFGLSREWLREEVLRDIEFGETNGREKSAWNYIPDVDIRRVLLKRLHQEHGHSWGIEDIAIYTGMARATFSTGMGQTLYPRPCLPKSVIMQHVQSKMPFADIVRALKGDYDAWNTAEHERRVAEEKRERQRQEAESMAKEVERKRKLQELYARIAEDDTSAWEWHAHMLSAKILYDTGSERWSEEGRLYHTMRYGKTAYIQAWKNEWRRRKADKTYWQQCSDDSAFQNKAELEVIRFLFRCHQAGQYLDLAAQRWEYGPDPAVPSQSMEASQQEEATSPVFAVSAPTFSRPVTPLPPLPKPSLLDQCYNHIYIVQEELKRLAGIHERLREKQAFFESLLPHATEDEQGELHKWIGKIRDAIGDIQRAA